MSRIVFDVHHGHVSRCRLAMIWLVMVDGKNGGKIRSTCCHLHFSLLEEKQKPKSLSTPIEEKWHTMDSKLPTEQHANNKEEARRSDRSPSSERGRSRSKRRSDRSALSRSSSSSSRSRHKHRKRHSSRDHHKEKKRRRSYSSSSDSNSTDSRRRKKNKKHKKRSKSKKRREKKKSSKKEQRKKSSGHSDDSSSSSSDGEDGPEVRRSVITGKKIKMHIDKTDDDLVRERARKEMLKFMNQSV